MNVELFILDPITRLVDINRSWISTVKEFKKILARDRGSKGDIDARKKLQATKEFTFIYHLIDYKSQFTNYSESERIDQSRINADLPEGFDYTKDEDLVLAIKRYSTLQETPSLKILAEAKEGLHSAHKVIRKIRTSLETKLEAMDMDELNTEEKNGKTIITDPVTKLTKNLEALMSLTNQIGPALKNIKDLEIEIKKELGEKKALRGDKEKGEREDKGKIIAIAPSREGESRQGNGSTIFDDL